MNAGWYFTASWDPITIRRGDALGLRAGADYFADLIAPGLSNGTSNARWITLLAWCLKWSHVAWHHADGGDLSRRDAQRVRYAWLRPLELLWVDRTLESGQTTGQLRGKRSIERWRKEARKFSNFAMSPDQFHRYRQVGTYGAYRVIFCAIPGLTTGDGWTLTETGILLANLVDESLPRDVRLNQKHFENRVKWSHWIDDEARYWVERGWPTALEKTDSGLLPTPTDAISKRLPKEEGRLLEFVLFSADSTRRATAEALASAKGEKSHADLCDILANSNPLSKKIEPASLAPLPAFTRLADSAMDAMRTLWDGINCNGENQAPAIENLARSNDLQSKFKRLRKVSKVWLCAPGRNTFPHEQVATQLAEAMRDAGSPIDQIRALARHHHEHGSGRRWFREQAGKIVPLVAYTGIAASDYRFRLRSICLLAAQCGVADMKVALRAVMQDRSDDDDEDIP